MRITPQFAELREALEDGRAELAEATTAPDPELVAVFDLAGSVDAFMRAARLVDGLEFLADMQEDRVDADEEFYYEDTGGISDDLVPQSLYLVMTNARAVQELVRLFELWQQDPSVTFDRGLNPLKDVFALLRAIRRWGPEDRVRETGLLDQWREDLSVVGANGSTRIEIELWYRKESSTRAEAEATVRDIVIALGGTVVTSSEIAAIAFHGLLADVPMAAVQRVLEHGPEAIELLTAEYVMLVSPNIPMSFSAGEPTAPPTLQVDDTLPSGSPRTALLDGVPLANHVALHGRLVIDDADDRESRYLASQRCHGTAMASLIVHGDLADPQPALTRPLYVRPILEPHEMFERTEVVPADELLVDLVHRAFRRMFEGDGSAPPAAPSVRIVNLSIGDPARTFVRRMSPLARLIDWLTHKYNLVVIISAGNHGEVSPAIPTNILDDPSQTATATARAMHDAARHRRLLSPAEAINAITVGALHADGSTVELPSSIVDLLPAGLPATYSAAGFGFRRSVKPDALMPGGRQVYVSPTEPGEAPTHLTPAPTLGIGPGLAVAAPARDATLDSINFSCGTSNAAALATRSMNTVFDVLESLTSEQDEHPFPDPQYHPVLAKALFVHAAAWHELRSDVARLLGVSGTDVRRELTRLMGYGPVHPQRLATADSSRVLLLGAGSISKDKRHAFRIPLPSALSASTEWRRLTVTLAWLSPVNVHSQKYRMARLSFRDPRDQLGVSPVEAEHNAVLKGTVQHQVFEGKSVVAFVDGASLSLDVDCRVDAGTLPSPVRFAIVASIEIANTARIDIHEQVRQGLTAIRTQARAHVRAT